MEAVDLSGVGDSSAPAFLQPRPFLEPCLQNKGLV